MDTVLVSTRGGAHLGPGSWVGRNVAETNVQTSLSPPPEPGARKVRVVVEVDS